MDPITMGLGVFGLGFGGYTSLLRFTNPEKLGKLQPMRQKFGATAGNAIHLAAYSVAPIVFGVTMILAGLQGVSVL